MMLTDEYAIDMKVDLRLADHEELDEGFHIDISYFRYDPDEAIKIGEIKGFIGAEDKLLAAFEAIGDEMYVFGKMYQESKVEFEDYWLDKLIYIDNFYLNPKWHGLGIEQSAIKTLYNKLGYLVGSIWYIVRPETRSDDGCPLYPEDPIAEEYMRTVFRCLDFKPKKRDCYDYMYLLCEDQNPCMNEVIALDNRIDLGLKDDIPFVNRWYLEKIEKRSRRPNAAVVDIKTACPVSPQTPSKE